VSRALQAILVTALTAALALAVGTWAGNQISDSFAKVQGALEVRP
jgi:hypothetical protein